MEEDRDGDGGVGGGQNFEFIAHFERAQVIVIWNQERKDGTGAERVWRLDLFAERGFCTSHIAILALGAA
jgi:hypothetical protein